MCFLYTFRTVHYVIGIIFAMSCMWLLLCALSNFASFVGEGGGTPTRPRSSQKEIAHANSRVHESNLSSWIMLLHAVRWRAGNCVFVEFCRNTRREFHGFWILQISFDVENDTVTAIKILLLFHVASVVGVSYYVSDYITSNRWGLYDKKNRCSIFVRTYRGRFQTTPKSIEQAPKH